MATFTLFDTQQKTGTNTTGADLDVCVKHHYTTSAPTVSNDTTDGVDIGDEWTDTSTGYIYKCTDNTTGAAVWNQIYPSTNTGYSWITKTAAYTMVTGDGILADSSSAAFPLTLPATPSAGNTVKIKDGASSGSHGINNVTVARNGSTIRGAASDFTMDVHFGWAEFTYDGATWQVTTGFDVDQLINLSGLGSDINLAVGQVGYIDFSASTSIALNVKTADGQRYGLEWDCTGTAAANLLYLYPNNTTYASACGFHEDYGGNSTPGAATTTESSLRLGVGGTPDVGSVTVSTDTTKKKRAIGSSYDVGTTTVYTGTIHADWSDTSTAYSSLGTLTCSTSITGRAYVRRLL